MILRASDQILDRNARVIRRNVALLDAFVTRHSDLFEWVRPSAGAIAFLKFTGPLTSEQLGAELAEVGVGIKPSYCFGDDGDSDEGWFRVGYGEERGFPEALGALSTFVDERRERWTLQRAEHEPPGLSKL